MAECVEETVKVTCSRCDKVFPSIFGTNHQGEYCACSLEIYAGPAPAPIARPQAFNGELPPYWVSIAQDAHAKNRLSPGYGSGYDLCEFAFTHPFTGEELTKDEIMDRHLWIDQNTNICDTCIGDMLVYGELKKTVDDGEIWELSDGEISPETYHYMKKISDGEEDSFERPF